MGDIIFRGGRRLPTFTAESMRKAILLSGHLSLLGPPPSSSFDYAAPVIKAVGANGWGMDGNDEWGDCVFADCSHSHMTWTANNGAIEVPTADQTLALYSACTGFNINAGPSGNNPTDQGAEIGQTCQYLEKNGYMGNKLAAFVDVSPAVFDHVRWAIQLFGGVKLGINLPESAMLQFNAGKPWKYIGPSRILGGHDVYAVKYTGHILWVVTYGRLIYMGPMFFQQYVTEVKAVISNNWIGQSGMAPSGFNMETLMAQLALEGENVE